MAKRKGKGKKKSGARVSSKVRKAYNTIKKHIASLEREETTHLGKLKQVQQEIKQLRDLK